MNEKAPTYLKNLTPQCNLSVRTRRNRIPKFQCRTDCFKSSFFSSSLSDWFNLYASIRNSESLDIFKSRLLSFIRSVSRNVYNMFDPVGLKLLTRLCLGLGHLKGHRFRHNFQECINPLCSCSLDMEDTSHKLLHCQHFDQHLIDLINSVNYFFEDLISLPKKKK